jgi:SAM-dependent methyltransferase
MSTSAEELREEVRARYAESALAVTGQGEGCGCGSGGCCVDNTDGGKFGEALYAAEQRGELPDAAVLASLGCGNPTAVADLHEGETVLDLGSGGGIDVILSARRVGPTGTAYGLDMTDEMLALARENQREAGIENVEFLKGEIEAVPLPDDHVDVIISNCVINLSSEKEKVVSESYRVLKPGGRFAVTDVVFLDEKARLPAEVTRSVGMWTGCISGALEKSEYEAMLEAAGFEDVSVEVTHTYPPEQMDVPLGQEGVEALREVPFASAFVRAMKPTG